MHTTDVHLRPMRPDEFDRFHERSRREYIDEIAANGAGGRAAAEAKADRDLAELLPDGLASPDQHVYAIVAGDGDQVGELWLGLRGPEGDREAFGYDFWVRPELRGGGIGRRAMAAAAEEARRLGAVRLALNVFGDNARARHLYESFGFRVTSTNMAMRLAEVPTTDGAPPGYDRAMEHSVEITRTENANPDVPDALHLRCACGWTASAHDPAVAEELTRAHVASGDPTPVPAAPSPD
ncbi:MAG: family N-acetyltransferase [Thermoleophilia bacterium]|nr:family N-acetyltransferase [Thermoleophilia bacterium]